MFLMHQNEHFLAGAWSEVGPAYVWGFEWGLPPRLVLRVGMEGKQFCQN